MIIHLLDLIKKLFLFLTSHLKIVIIIYIIIQLLYAIFSPVQYSSDSLYYYKLAQDCLNTSTLYPSPHHIYEDYIVAPVYINFLILVLSVFNSPNAISVVNVALNLLQLLLVYKITGLIFNRQAAEIAVLIFILYLTSLSMILFNLTELFFMVIILSSLFFYLKGGKIYYLFSGILAAAAIGVRPTGWGLIGAYFIIDLLRLKSEKKFRNRSLLLYAGFLMFIILVGYLNEYRVNEFIFTSTTGPANLLIGANDFATGAFNGRVFDKGNVGYIENPEKLTYIQKGNFWQKTALNWIHEHPVKWISMIPAKLAYLFLWDDFSLSRLVYIYDWNLYRVLKTIKEKSFNQVLINHSNFQKASYLAILVIHHVYYFLILFCACWTIITGWRKMIHNEALLIILIFILAGISFSIITVGDARYKYPFIILFFIFISPVIHNFTTSKSLFFKKIKRIN